MERPLTPAQRRRLVEMLEGRDITGNNRAWLGLKRAGLVEYVHPIGYLLTDTGRDRARDARNFWPRRW